MLAVFLWRRKIVVVNDFFPTALEVGAYQVMNKISQCNIRVSIKTNVDAVLDRGDATVANASGGWLPPISMSVKNIPRLTIRSAFSTRARIPAGVMAPTLDAHV